MATAGLNRKARQFNQPGRTEYRLKMTVRILIAAALLALATACSSPTTETATPRPTDTPSPTYTPEPLLPPGNINSLPTPVPLPPLGPSSALPTPTISPDIFQEVGDKEWFFGATALELERANQAFDEGRYQDALEAYLEAQRLHGEPSITIQGLIGSSYLALGQPETAIQHFTNALELKDTPINRINRARSYMKTGHCPPAINDAKAALTMEHEAGEGIHSDAEANDILTSCYAEQGEYLLALQHAEVTLEIAEENRYAETELEYVSRVRDSLQAVVDGRTWPEDLILGPATTVFYAGTAFLEEGQYEEAIANFNAAQENHGTASGTIQTLLGHAHSALGHHETALTHYTNAVEIRDSSLHRANRAHEYAGNGRCTEATVDVETALAIDPHVEPGYHTSVEAHWIMASCHLDQGNQEAALHHGKAAIDLAREHGYQEEGIRLIEEILVIAEAADRSEEHPADLAEKYRLAGEELDADRSPRLKWMDQSNWQDGVSHLLPELPLEPGAAIKTGMTCTQSEALMMAVFPEGEDPMTWHLEPNIEDIVEQWGLNLATTIWGEHPEAMEWYYRETFEETCGTVMQ